VVVVVLAVVGLLLESVGAVAGIRYVKFEEARVRRGWKLIPVVVVNQKVSPGTVVTYDLVSQRPIPEQFVTRSIIRPDEIDGLIGKVIGASLDDHDPLRWGDLVEFRDPSACRISPALPQGVPETAIPLWRAAHLVDAGAAP
jgi:Flp pilus assembly protein CpaB